MKKICLVAVLLLAVLLSSVTSYAEQLSVSDIYSYRIDAEVLPNGRTVASIFEETYAESWCARYFPGHDEKYNLDCYYDMDKYVIVYVSTLRKWSEDPTWQGVISNMADNPTIFIPMFAVLDGRERIVGHVKAEYDLLTNKYRCTATMNATDDPRFISGEQQHFIEALGFFDNYQGIRDAIGEEIRSITLFAYSIFDLGAKFALVSTESGNLMVYDYMNCAHLPETDASPLMSIEEFTNAHDAYLSQLEIEDEGKWIAKGDSPIISTPTPKNSQTAIVVVVGLVLIAGAGVVTVLVLKKKRRAAVPQPPEAEYPENGD